MELPKGRGLQSKPKVANGGRYFFGFIDTSRSMRETMVGDKSLFDIQLEQMNALVSALMQGKQRDKTWFLLVSCEGAVMPGWQKIMKVDPIIKEKLPDNICSPILDMLAAIFDTVEELVLEAVQVGAGVTFGMMVATDGLDGFSVDGVSYPVSVSTVEELRPRVNRFVQSGYIANALAIGRDGGSEVASFFSSLGFSPDSIHKSELDASKLRRAFQDVSESSINFFS